MTDSCFGATGRRKRAVARVRLKPGTGKRIVNGLPMREYLGREVLVMMVEQPFELTSTSDKFDMIATCKGGGVAGQAGAILLGIARALILTDPSLRKELKATGFLTRDSRMVERKKYGQPKARKRFQFSKR